jgi:hypothetical protein
MKFELQVASEFGLFKSGVDDRPSGTSADTAFFKTLVRWRCRPQDLCIALRTRAVNRRGVLAARAAAFSSRLLPKRSDQHLDLQLALHAGR